MSDSYSVLFRKIAYQATLVVGMLLLASFVYAQVSERRGEIEQTVHVFPGSISSNGWSNTETLLIQNLDGDALYQDFNRLNAAYIKENARLDLTRNVHISEPDVAEDPADSSATTTDAVVIATSTVIDTAEPATTTEAAGDDGSPEPAPETLDETAVVSEVATSTEAVSTTTNPVILDGSGATTSTSTAVLNEAPTSDRSTTSGTTTVFKTVSEQFAFVFETATSYFPFLTTTVTSTTATEVEVEPVEPTAMAPITTAIEETELTEADVFATSSEAAAVEPLTQTATASVATSTGATPLVATTTPLSETLADFVVPAPAIDSADEAEEEVTEKFSLTLSDFWLPTFAEEGVRINGGQIRFSLAAQKRTLRIEEPAHFVIEYSENNGDTWQSGGEIDIIDEVSNSLNGDYYLFALPQLATAADVQSLSLRISFVGDRADMEEVYVDAAWLELFTIEGEPTIDDVLAEFDDNFQNAVLEGDTLVLPNGEVITFDFTDENADEDLIIKSDDVRYEGLTRATMYFNVSNVSNRADEFSVKTYFPSGVGEVTSLEVWQQNKPREVVIPDIRPYVYHCAGGWQLTSESATPSTTPEAASAVFTPERSDVLLPNFSTTTAATSSTATTSTTTVQSRLVDTFAFVQATATSSAEEQASGASYFCPATEHVQTCDYVANDTVDCHVTHARVAEHVRTAYRSGWEVESFSTSTEKTDTSRLARLGGLLGTAPAVKPVPDTFEARTETEDAFAIQAGETRYFKMEISFPAFSNGEFWIEAIGTRAYGLLDPFWNSSWTYKLPVSIDNTAATATSTEQQVFLELTSAGLGDFWSNVNSDGSDVRFIRETPGNEATWFDTAYAKRQELPITMGANAPDGGYLDYTVRVQLDTATLVGAGELLSSCDDLRVVYASSGVGTEIDRIISDCNTATTSIMFALQANHATSTTVNDYYLYYDNVTATTPPADAESVYLWYDDVSSDRLADYTNDQGDNWLGGSTAASTAYNAAGYYTFDTGDNFNESIRIPNSTLSERDVYFEAEWFITTCYPSNVGFGNYARYVANNEYYAAQRSEAALPSCNGGGYGQDGDIVEDARTTVVVDGPDIGDIVDNQYRKMTIAAWGINDTNLKYWDIDDASTESVPGFIEATTQASGTDTTDIESAGEVGLQYSQVGGRVRNLLARRYIEPEPAVVASTIEDYQPTTFSELDFWMPYFDSTAQAADIWLQTDVLAPAASTTVYLYYGNSSASSGSDEVAPFSYSTSTALYYVVDDNAATTELSIVSLIDNNEIRFDGGGAITLDEGERYATSTFSATTEISVLGPISGTVRSTGNDSSETIAPISFATTTFAIPQNRGNEFTYVLAPFASTSVQTFIGAGAVDQTASIATGSVNTFTTNPSDSGLGTSGNGTVVEASSPVLVMQRTSNPGDGIVPVPPTTRDIYGFDSNHAQLSAIVAATTSIYCSNGNTGSSTPDRGEKFDVPLTACGATTQNSGNALRVTDATNPVTGLQQADGDGNEATVFWPDIEFGTRYGISNNAQYIAVICAPKYGEVELELRDATGLAIASLTCSPGTKNPGTQYFGETANGLEFVAGHELVSTNGAPFYAVFEDISGEANGDEKNILGPVQARKFGAERFAYSFGAQEINQDARWAQHSYRWYENEDAEPPTTAWDAGEGTQVAEAEAITDAGAVDGSDELRLRINLLAQNATGTINSTAFTLQYAPVGTCSAALETDWSEVGQIGSTTAAFVGFNNASLSDTDFISTSTLASTTILGTYEEENDSDSLSVEVPVNEVIEFDWVITPQNPAFNTEYCFRLVRSDESNLFAYTTYPELITSGPPLAPTLTTPFADKHEPDPDTVFEFFATDISGDDLDYQIQIDDTFDFTSTVVDYSSQVQSLDFTNLTTPSDKRPFTAGELMQFTSPLTLTSSTTYWWRVRAIDPSGSNVFGDWSTPQAFTINESLAVDEWYQTTGDQFSQNTLSNIATSSGAATASAVGQMVTPTIDFDDAIVGNAWGSFDFNFTGNATVTIEYLVNGGWAPVPDEDLSGNSNGFITGPVNILPLDTDTYNQIRLVADMDSGASMSDWQVTWGLRVTTPVLSEPFDHELESDSTPQFVFSASDPQTDDLFYEFSISSTSDFTASTTVDSATSPDFANQSTPADTHPFNSGDTITYTMPATLSTSTTYWWRVRAKDPSGGDAFSPWSDPFAFTIGTTSASTWFQTTADQFDTNTLSGVNASSSVEAVVVSSQVGLYGSVTLTDNDWSTVNLTQSFSDMVVVASPEWAVTNSNGRTPRVRNKTATSFEIKVDNESNNLTGSTDVDYLVMESGEWTIDDGGSGVRVIAGTIENESQVHIQPYATSYVSGTQIDFSPTFSTAPAALVTVSSDNDTDWVKDFVDGCGVTSGNLDLVTTDEMCPSLGLSTIDSAIHGDEDLDYVVVEIVDTTVNGVDIKSFVVPISGSAPDGNGNPVSFPTAFSSAPAITLVQQNGENGGDGGFASKSTSGTNDADELFVQITEFGPQEGAHTNEAVSVVAFESASGILTRSSGAGSLTGLATSETINFADGIGPKFAEFSWNDTTPGASSILYQIEYSTDATTWSLVPDSLITDNSTGTSTGAIDLTTIDVATHPYIRLLASFTCNATDCPQLNDWQVTWADGVDMSGEVFEFDRSTPVTSGTVRAYVNTTQVTNSAVIQGDGSWTLSGVTAFLGDTVTVYVDGAAEADEAVTVFVYDGVGDITGVQLFEQHLAVAADETTAVTNANLVADFTSTGQEDIFIENDISNNVTVCGQGTCDFASVYVAPGNSFIPGTTTAVSLDTFNFTNAGTVDLGQSTLTVAGTYANNAVLTASDSTVVITSTSTDVGMIDTSGSFALNNLTFALGTSSVVVTPAGNLDLSGTLTVATGTYDRTGRDIAVAGSIMTGSDGFWSGYGTTTFDGIGTSNWSDTNPVLQNIGNLYIDGTPKTVVMMGDVRATDVTIGSNDTLNAGGHTIEVAGNWTNAGTFVAGTSQVRFIDDPNGYNAGGSIQIDWYDGDFTYRSDITIASTSVSGALSNFPVYVDLSTLGQTFWDNVRSDGGDIRVTTSDGQSQVPTELVLFDDGADTGSLYFRANTLSNVSDTTFYIYYGNAATTSVASTSTFGSQNVWSNNYLAVYHFEGEGQSGVDNVDEYQDSTANQYHAEDDTLATGNAGFVGEGVEFDVANSVGGLDGADHINVPFEVVDGRAEMTYSVWYQTSNSSVNHTLLSSDSADSGNEWIAWLTTTPQMQQFTESAQTAYSIPLVADGIWTHYTYTRSSNGVGDFVGNFVNGSEVGTDTDIAGDTTIESRANGLVIGMEQDGTDTIGGSAANLLQVLDGFVDEVRFANGIRSDEWIEAEYDTLNNPLSFYATGTSELVATFGNEVPSHVVTAAADFYQFMVADATTSVSFVDTSVTISDDFTIATGTITFPNTSLTVGGSFANTGGTFLHNNAEVIFSGSGSETIEQQGTALLNTFYDVRFTGSGNWSYIDTNATTSRFYTIQNGIVTFPSGQLTIGDDFTVSGSGSFAANAGEVVFINTDTENISAGGSSFNDVRIIGNTGSGWYDTSWSSRLGLTINNTYVNEPLTDFPVYVDLADLDDSFWAVVESGGSDIRVTDATGVTELPIELVGIDTGAKTGQLHFEANTIASSTDTTFYIYFGNSDALTYAVTDPFGRNAVWNNGYEAVFHLEETGTGATGEYIDSTGNGYDGQGGGGTATDVPTASTGFLGTAQDFENDAPEDWIDLNTSMITGMEGANPKTVSAWANTESWSDSGGLWNFGGSNTEQDFSVRINGTEVWRAQYWGNDETFTANPIGDWQHVAITYDGATTRNYTNAVNFDTDLKTLDTQDVSGFGVLIGRWRTGNYFDGLIDEVRFSSAERSADWLQSAFVNQASSSIFYATSTVGSVSGRIMSDTNLLVAGDLTIDGGAAVFPEGILTLRGSLDNSSVFSANGGTVLLNALSGAHTIAAGTSSFANLTVNAPGGDYTIIENATSTGLVDLSTANSFVLDSGITLALTDTFQQSISSASTTWSGSTLIFTGPDHTINNKTHGGDTYDNVIVSGDTDIKVWNSDVSNLTNNDTSSWYSQDNNGIDGDLYIFGTYTVASGTEYWSYATDWDGTDLAASSSERVVSVVMASGTIITITGTLEVLGSSTATSTIESASGTYQLDLIGATTTQQFASYTGVNQAGLNLQLGTQITQLSDTIFIVASSSNGISVDAATVNTNPTAGFERVSFNLVSGSAVNVSLDGIAGTYWRFSNGDGSIYGEAFDDDDGDPGSIQWDDSLFSSTIAGTVYADTGSSTMGGPTCNGIDTAVTIVVNGTDSYQVPCNPSDGSYQVSGVSYSGSPSITAYLDRDGYVASDETSVTLVDELSGTGIATDPYGNQIRISRPTSTADGSLLVVMIGKDDDDSIVAPEGWVEVSAIGTTANDELFTGLYYRAVVSSSTEPITYTFTTTDSEEGYSWWLGEFSGADLDDPFDDTAAWTQLVDDTTPDAPSVTTTGTNRYVLAAWYVRDDTNITMPGGSWTTRIEDLANTNAQDNGDFDNNTNNLSIASQVFASAGATGAVNITGVAGGRDVHVGQFAIQPASFTTGTATAATVTVLPPESVSGVLTGEPSIRASYGNIVNVAAFSSFTVPEPGAESGDVLIAIVGKDDDPAITPPAGWTEITTPGSISAGGDNLFAGAWYKVVTDINAESSTYSFTSIDSNTENVSYWIGAVQNVDPANPIEITNSWEALFDENPATAASLTTTNENSLVFATWFVGNGDNDVTTPGAPWTTVIEDLQNSNRNLNISTQLLATAGASGGADLTDITTTEETLALQFALRSKGPDFSSIIDLDLYGQNVIARHENGGPATVDAFALYDTTDDSDIPFTAATSTTDALTVSDSNGLYIWSNNTFTPEGTATLEGGGDGNPYDGTLTVGPGATFTAYPSETLTIGGSLFVDTGGSYVSSGALVDFTASTSGWEIGAAGSSTIAFDDLTFTGAGGTWSVQTPITVAGTTTVATGTVQGSSDIAIDQGSLTGNGTVAMSGGTVTINQSNQFGGTQPWSFNNLTFGDGVTGGAVTTAETTSTTTVNGVLRIANGHVLDAGPSTWNLTGNGTVFVETGTFFEDTSTIQYSGSTPNIAQTAHYNVVIDSTTNTVSALAPNSGLQIFGDLDIGHATNSLLDVTTNDPLLTVVGDVTIGTFGTLNASDSSVAQFVGSYTNHGVFTANGGTVNFTNPSGLATIAAGSSSFATVAISGTGDFSVVEHATATGAYTIGTVGSYIQQPNTQLAVGGTFANNDGSVTTWATSTLILYSGTAFEVNSKLTSDNYHDVVVRNNTHPRFWSSDYVSVTTAGTSSVYSMDHAGVAGDLYIYGDYVNTGYADHWSYENDWDGTLLGVPRTAVVQVTGGGSLTYTGGSLTISGSSTASTTVSNQGSGTFDWTIGGTAGFLMQYVVPRDVSVDGLSFIDTPTVSGIDNVDFAVSLGSATALTVDGTVINQNPALNFNDNQFNEIGSPASPNNVRFTGSSVSSWRFTNETGNLAGETYDDDSGDPGEIVWTDSAQEVTISGNIYLDEGVNWYTECDGITENVRIVVGGLTATTTTCASGSGFYEFNNVNFGLSDSVIVYIDDESESGAAVTVDLVSNITNMDIYVDRVIVRNESTDAIQIADLAAWDSINDPDVPFTATTGTPDSLTLPTDTELIVWDNKTFEPGGNVTTTTGTGSFSGDITLYPDAEFVAQTTESHTIGGSLEAQTDAVFTAASSTLTFTSTQAGETIDVNEADLNNLTFSGNGDWTITDATLAVYGDVAVTGGGTLTLPATTTAAANLVVSSGTLDSNTGVIFLTATDSGNLLTLNGSSLHRVVVNGAGGAYTITDTQATTTDSLEVLAGSLILPSGSLAIGNNFVVTDTIVHNSGLVSMFGTGTHTLTLSGNDLNALTMAGVGTVTMTDGSAALADDLIVAAGTLVLATSTIAVGGSLDATGGVMDTGSTTLLFDSTNVGETVDPGSNELYNVLINSGSGGWTFASATTTNDFSLLNASVFTLSASEALNVGGVFTNEVGGAATTWTGSTLQLRGSTTYSVSSKTISPENYGSLVVTGNTDVRFWQSDFATTTVDALASVYSQDHGGVDGTLYIAGTFEAGSGSEYWSYATDFDGVSLGGGSRAVTVTFDDTTSAGFSMSGGSLAVLGSAGSTSTIQSLSGGQYGMALSGGTLQANYHEWNDLNATGIALSDSVTVADLNQGTFNLAVNSGRLVNLDLDTLNANASLVIEETEWNSSGFTGGRNVAVAATSSSFWTFRSHTGDLAGENFDIDGSEDCDSLRWEDSDCLLIEQSNYRWRNDDGDLAVPASDWFDVSWAARERVRLVNDDLTAYTNTAVLINVTYEALMQTDFDDLRFTDASGTTTVPYWIERHVAGDNADVWLQVPSLPADDTATFFMYYNNGSATTTSSSTQVFSAADDFEDGDMAEYFGDTSLYEASAAFNYGGTYGIAPTTGNEGTRATEGIAQFDSLVSQGDLIRYRQYVDVVAGDEDESCFMFGVVSSTSISQNYGVCYNLFGTDKITLVEDVESTDTVGGVTILGSTTVDFTGTYGTGWYETEIDWQTDNTIDVRLYSPAGVLIATTSATDSTYTSGGFGFTSWGQNGGWDSVVAYPRITTKPTVLFGAQQTDGGASWAALQNTPLANVALNTPYRLRVSIDNTGLDRTGQFFELEYAPRGTAPVCASVDTTDFVSVPVAASCGGSPICMTGSTQFSNGDATVDLLLGTQGTFVAGEAIEDASNQTASLDLLQDRYTELEYAIAATSNVADDAYCLRVTDNGTELDSYAVVPELSLEFTPTVGTVQFNEGLVISLDPGATTTVLATTTITDLNGFSDISFATTTLYRSDVAGLADCTEDDNNCYRETTNSACTLSGCVGNSCELSCTFDLQYHTDPTDEDGGVFWYAYVEAVDSTGNSDFNTSLANDVGTLRALSVQNAIDYGTLDINGSSTAAANPVNVIENIGNSAIDLDVSGSDLTDGAASVIGVGEQRFATSSFDYSACALCSILDVFDTSIDLDLAKPTTTVPTTNDQLYWGIRIPFGTASAPHTGLNTFSATAPI